MHMLVEIQFCTNCQQHIQYSQHEQSRFIYYFQKIKEVLESASGENVMVRQMMHPKHYRKINKSVKDNKYYDTLIHKEVFFPRIGAFQVYVNHILFFSKLKSHAWPNWHQITEDIFDMLATKQQNKIDPNFIFEQNQEKQKDINQRRMQRKRFLSTKIIKRQMNTGQFEQHQSQVNNTINFKDHIDVQSSKLNQVQPFARSKTNQRYKNQPVNRNRNVNSPTQNKNNQHLKLIHNIYDSAINQLRSHRKDRNNSNLSKRKMSQIKKIISPKKNKGLSIKQKIKIKYSSKQLMHISLQGNNHYTNSKLKNLQKQISQPRKIYNPIQQRIGSKTLRKVIQDQLKCQLLKNSYKDQEQFQQFLQENNENQGQQKYFDDFVVKSQTISKQQSQQFYSNIYSKIKDKKKYQQIDDNQQQKGISNSKEYGYEQQIKGQSIEENPMNKEIYTYSENFEQFTQPQQKLVQYIDKGSSALRLESAFKIRKLSDYQYTNQLQKSIDNQIEIQQIKQNTKQKNINSFTTNLVLEVLIQSPNKNKDIQKQKTDNFTINSVVEQTIQNKKVQQIQQLNIKGNNFAIGSVIDQRIQNKKVQQVQQQSTKVTNLTINSVVDQLIQTKIQKLQQQLNVRVNNFAINSVLDQLIQYKKVQQIQQVSIKANNFFINPVVEQTIISTVIQNKRQSNNFSFQKVDDIFINSIAQKTDQIIQKKDNLSLVLAFDQIILSKAIVIQQQSTVKKHDFAITSIFNQTIINRQQNVNSINNLQKKQQQGQSPEKQQKHNQVQQIQNQYQQNKDILQNKQVQKAQSKQRELDNKQLRDQVQQKSSLLKEQNKNQIQVDFQKNQQQIRGQQKAIPQNNICIQKQEQIIQVEKEIILPNQTIEQITIVRQLQNEKIQTKHIEQPSQFQPQSIIQSPIKNSLLGELSKQSSLQNLKSNSKLQYNEIKLTISTDKSVNPFLDNFSLNQNVVKKVKGSGVWHILKTQQILPSTGKYFFSVTVAKSELNCIEVGIIPQDFKIIQNKICDKSIGFHIANGKVHDSKGAMQKKNTVWRVICQPIVKGTLGTLQIFVNTQKRLIVWRFQGKIIGKSVITDYLKNRPCNAYIIILHENDQIILHSNLKSQIHSTGSKVRKQINQLQTSNKTFIKPFNQIQTKLKIGPQKIVENLDDNHVEAKMHELPSKLQTNNDKIILEQTSSLLKNTEQKKQLNLSPIKDSLLGELSKQSSLQNLKSNQKPNKLQYKQLKLTISTDKSVNPFLDNFSLNQNVIKKVKGQGVWHILKTQQILPSTGKYFFSVNVAKSELNCIEVGIIPQDFKIIQNKICNKSIGFHIANGKVHDTKGAMQKKNTVWRVICQPIVKGTLGTLQIFVNTQKRLIVWRFQGKIIGKSVITDYIKDRPCNAYIIILHEKDQIIFGKTGISQINRSNLNQSSQYKYTTPIDVLPTQSIIGNRIQQTKQIPQDD